jgi:hypothetical protein
VPATRLAFAADVDPTSFDKTTFQSQMKTALQTKSNVTIAADDIIINYTPGSTTVNFTFVGAEAVAASQGAAVMSDAEYSSMGLSGVTLRAAAADSGAEPTAAAAPGEQRFGRFSRAGAMAIAAGIALIGVAVLGVVLFKLKRRMARRAADEGAAGGLATMLSPQQQQRDTQLLRQLDLVELQENFGIDRDLI